MSRATAQHGTGAVTDSSTETRSAPSWTTLRLAALIGLSYELIGLEPGNLVATGLILVCRAVALVRERARKSGLRARVTREARNRGGLPSVRARG